jgi:hypothetical protein
MSAEAILRGRISELVNMYCELCQVNRRIGIWDMRRHAECKLPLQDIDKAHLVKTERLGRQSVERRAVVKNRIDALFAEIAKFRLEDSNASPS